MHDDRVFLGRIEVGRLDHPAVEGDTLGSSEGEELLFGRLKLGQILREFVVVEHLANHLALAVHDRIDIGVVGVAPAVEEVAVVAREGGVVPSFRAREGGHTPLLVGHVDLALHGRAASSLEVSVARGGIITVDGRHVVVTLLDLAQEFSLLIIKVEVQMAVAVGRHEDVVLHDGNIAHGLALDILLHALLQQEARLARRGVGVMETEAVLVAVHRIEDDAACVGRRLDAGDVSISIQRQIVLLRATIVEVIDPSRDLGVVLSRLRILIAILARIDLILLVGRIHAGKYLERIGLHATLVVADPAQRAAVCAPCDGVVESKLLLVHPVGDTVDDLVELAIGRDLALRRAIGNEDVVLSHEGDFLTIRREGRDLLGSVLRELAKLLALDVIDIEVGSIGATVDSPVVGLDEQMLSVVGHLVAVKALDLLALRIVEIEERLLTCDEGVSHHLLAVGRDLCILGSTLDWTHARDSLGDVLPARDIFQRKRLPGKHLYCCREQESTRDKNAFHLVL